MERHSVSHDGHRPGRARLDISALRLSASRRVAIALVPIAVLWLLVAVATDMFR